jgi:hypothetical protein
MRSFRCEIGQALVVRRMDEVKQNHCSVKTSNKTTRFARFTGVQPQHSGGRDCLARVSSLIAKILIAVLSVQGLIAHGSAV